MNNPIVENDKYSANMQMFFCINNITYSVPASSVIEVLPFCQLMAPQKMQKYTIGLLDYNGTLLNVIDLRKLFGFSQTDFSINQKFIILKNEESIFVIIVDEVNNIYDIDESSLQPAPYSASNLIQYIYNKSDSPVSVINISALDEEIKKADLCEQDTFNLPVLTEKDELIAQERAEKIKLARNNYEMTKYFEYFKYLAFECGNSKFCIDITCIEKVIDIAEGLITKIPNNTNYLEGVINFRGSFLTVVNFGKILELPDNSHYSQENNKIIVISYNDFKVGLLVDKIFEISKINKEELIKTNEYSEICPFIHNQIVNDNDICFIIDVDDFLRDSRMYINE